MKPSQWFKHAAGALGAALAILGAPAQAQITTPQILGQTIAAMPSCLSYQVKGMCFFLYCSWTGCRIRTSIRVSHYVPDAIVSPYNAPLMHPWVEVGNALLAATSQRLTNREATEGTLGLRPAARRRSMPRRQASAAAWYWARRDTLNS